MATKEAEAREAGERVALERAARAEGQLAALEAMVAQLTAALGKLGRK